MSEVVMQPEEQKPQPLVVNINNAKQKAPKPEKPPKVLTPEQRFAKRFRKLRRYYFKMRLFNLFFHPPMPSVVFIPDYVALTLREFQAMLKDFNREMEAWKQSKQNEKAES